MKKMFIFKAINKEINKIIVINTTVTVTPIIISIII